MTDRYWTDLAELRETADVVVANELLVKGWELVKVVDLVASKVVAGTGQLQVESRPLYVMGRFRSGSPGYKKPCRTCGKEIILRKGQEPLNLDGTPHTD